MKGPSNTSEKLDRLRVAIVGAGAVGGNSAEDLARMQIGEIRIIDPKCYKAESILTQPIHPSEIGESKAHRTARLCQEISPATRTLYFPGRLESLPLPALHGVDVILLATDNLSVEVEAGQRALHLGIPLIHSSVHGETLVAQVRVFANEGPDSPCPACGFNQAEWAHLNAQASFSCSGEEAAETPGIPTTSIPSLCSMASNLAVTQLLRLVLGLGASVGNTLLDYCGFTHKTVTIPLLRKTACVCDHTRYRIETALRPLEACRLTDLADECELAADSCLFTVDDLSWAQRGVCSGCGSSQPIGRFVDRPAEAVLSCPTCSQPVFPEPFYLIRPVPARVLGSAMGRPLRELGASNPDSVLLSVSGKAVLFLNPTHHD